MSVVGVVGVMSVNAVVGEVRGETLDTDDSPDNGEVCVVCNEHSGEYCVIEENVLFVDVV